MKILISNDDGVYAPGIEMLAKALSPLCEHIAVVAPDRNLSGASSALTLTRPLYARVHHNSFISVDGTPADCVHLATTGMLDFTPERVVSGINTGPNLGADVIYSGTVAAAIEGRFLSQSPIAISLAGETHYATAARVATELVSTNRLPALPDTIFNVNVPDLPHHKLAGYRLTRLGSRTPVRSCIQTTTPRGQLCYWMGEAGDPRVDQQGTDFAAIAAGYVSITPLHLDMTNHQQMQSLQQWLHCSEVNR